MINLIKETIGEIPILHVVQERLHGEALPTVVYYHGYNGEKISSLTLAYQIAEKGFRVILPDSIYHGERKSNLSQTELDLAFWDIVLHSIDELSIIKEYLLDKGYSIDERIGIGGTSMGGITTYGALAKYDWISSAAVIMGTAYLTDYAKELIKHFNNTNEKQITTEEKVEVVKQLATYDITLQPEKLKERPLLIWHGEDDEVVPYAYSRAFYEAIQKFYNKKENLRFVSEKGRAHNVSRLAMNETASWFEKFL